MKKIFTLALVLTAFAATAFSKGPDAYVRKNIQNVFNKTYSSAKEVKWELVGAYTKVTFKIDGQQMFAYYRETGEQLALTRNILSAQLPIALSVQLKTKFSDQWLTELFEISSNGEIAYFATLYTADEITVYRAEPSCSWEVFRKSRRTAE